MELEIKQNNIIEIETGTVHSEPYLENLKVIPSGKEQIFNHPKSDGYDEVIVEAVASDTLNVVPSFENQTFEGLFNTVNVNAMNIPSEQWYVEEVETWT